MANVDAAFGLRPKRYLSGAPYNGATNRYYIPATDTNAAVYVGGLVKLTGGADSNGIPVVTGNVSTGDAVVGVVVAVEPSDDYSTLYRANSTARYVHVADDPNLLYEVQEDSTGAAMAATATGGTAQLTGFTSGSTVTGRSSIEIDSSNLSETADVDDDVLIVRAVQAPDNAIGDYCRWEVRLNNHAFVDAATGV